ncbi:hypothetical protein FV228_01385 [Methylobacterium sp. WL18]|uniref:hypothetical protein n=1 Tax=Methylobacterium sp. WL18 TaxID=2603897 RepID=UPI0011CB3123|nr:hypothetical protein [Methylobacterium sp. WL18]TXN76179.1 hypothetical protein FV228_01385 [Methylobacterium sp. WL18]
MTSNLLARLARLEATHASPVALDTSFTPALRLLRLLLAVYLGDLRPGEDVVAREARALGYENAVEMHSAMTANRTSVISWDSAHNMAVARMLAPFGGGAGAGITANRDALSALLTTLPVAFADLSDANPEHLDAAAEWVSL